MMDIFYNWIDELKIDLRMIKYYIKHDKHEIISENFMYENIIFYISFYDNIVRYCSL